MALTALEAELVIISEKGERSVPLKEFFVLPEVNYLKENILENGEIIKEIKIPVFTSDVHSGFMKFKERAVWDFAIVSVGAVVQVEANRIKSANVVFGGVAPVPWIDENFDARLKGSTIREGSIEGAVEKLFGNAEPLQKNGYKIPLIKNLTKRLILKIAG